MPFFQGRGLLVVSIGAVMVLMGLGLLLISSGFGRSKADSTGFESYVEAASEGRLVAQGDQVDTRQVVRTASMAEDQAAQVPARRVDQDSIDQLARLAHQATEHARGTDEDSVMPERQRALNEFEPGGNPDKSPDQEPEREAPPVPMDVLFEALDSLNPAAQACYETLREDFPEAGGKVHITFVFETEGGESRVQMAEIEERTTLFDRGLHDCLSEAVSQLVLPKTADDTRMVITNAFQFGPKKLK